MDEHHRIEREADEAFALFRKKWPVDDAGDPTGIEVWHHAWRAAVAAERQAAWDSVNAWIKPGDLGGSGCDQNAQRNGLILAANLLMKRLQELNEAPPRSAPESSGSKSSTRSNSDGR